ncbi:glycosyltransferase family 2 protein [Candidatus Daviesbacteria bacterium]|nr:glycosyltransferase family 2 protein [Candidatus Daviesbacteria bacterium]
MKISNEKISVIFPTFNGWQDTKRCLKSLQQVSYPKNKLEVWVIDNNSSDNTPALIKKNFPWVKIICQPKNLGYSKAVNLAVKKTKSDYILFSNNDVIFDKDFFTKMVQLAESNPKIGIIGGKCYNQKGGTIGFNGLRINPYLGYHQYDLNNLDSIRECDIPPAGGFFVRRKLINKIGSLDEGFFLYFEDIDYCIRTKRAGFKVLYNPNAVFYHISSKTAYREIRWEDIATIKYRSKWRCMFKHATVFQIVSSLAFQFSIVIAFENFNSSVKTYIPLIKGLYWNILNLKNTLNARRLVRRFY